MRNLLLLILLLPLIAFSGLSCTESSGAQSDYPPIRSNVGKALKQIDFPEPYITEINALIEKTPWYGTRHTGPCGTGADWGQNAFAKILKDAPVDDLILFLDHQSEYVRGAVHDVLDKRANSEMTSLQGYYQTGNSRIKFELARYVNPNVTYEEICGLLDEIIHNPDLGVYMSDLEYLYTKRPKNRFPAWSSERIGDDPIDHVGFCTRLLEDHFINDRAFALANLQRYGDKAVRAVPVLIELLKAPDESIFEEINGTEETTQRRLTAKVLGSIGEKADSAIPALTRVLDDPRSDVQCAAASALYEIGYEKDKQLDFIMRKLNEEKDGKYLPGIVESLGQIGRPARAAIPVLAELTRDAESDVSFYAMDAIEKIGGKGTLRRIINRNLRSSDPQVRIDALFSLDAEDPSTRRELFKALKDKDIEVKCYAVQELRSMDEPLKNLLPALIEIVQSDKTGREFCFSDALYMIKQMGPDAKSAIPSLVKSMKTSADYISQIVETIKAVGGDDKLIVKGLTDSISRNDPYRAQKLIYQLGKMGSSASSSLDLLISIRDTSPPEPDPYGSGGFSQMQRAADSAIAVIASSLKKDCDVPIATIVKMMDTESWETMSKLVDIATAKSADNKIIVDRLINLVKSGDRQVKDNATRKLAEMGSSAIDVLKTIREIDKSDGPLHASNLKNAARSIISDIKEDNKSNRKVLLESLESSDYFIHEEALKKYIELTGDYDTLIDRLIEITRNPDKEVSHLAAASLGNLKDKAARALPALKEYEIKGGNNAHTYITSIIDEIKADSDISCDDLLSVLDVCKGVYMDRIADKCILKCGNYDKISLKLADLAGSMDYTMHICACMSLFKLGDKAKAALPKLKKLQESDDRTQIAETIEWIERAVKKSESSKR